jgi:hypothetical protein
MFAYRHDILKSFISGGIKLVVLGPGESLADLPELKDQPANGQVDLLARMLRYRPDTKLLVVAEENVLADPRDANVGSNQVIHVLADAIYQVAGKRPVDPNWENRGRAIQQYELRVQRLDVRYDERLKELFGQATRAGKWKGTAAVHDRLSYWTEGVLAYFDALGETASPNDAIHPITNREALKQYDPDLFALVQQADDVGPELHVPLVLLNGFVTLGALLRRLDVGLVQLTVGVSLELVERPLMQKHAPVLADDLSDPRDVQDTPLGGE